MRTESQPHSTNRSFGLVLIGLLLLFAIFHTPIIKFFRNLGHRPEVLVITTPYYTTNPHTFVPTSVPTQLPGTTSHTPSDTGQLAYNPSDYSDEDMGNLPGTGPADIFLLLGALILFCGAIAFVLHSRRLQGRIRSAGTES